MRRAKEGMERIYGLEHPRTLSCTTILARVLSQQKMFDESEKLFEETIEAQRRVLGEEHRDTLVTMGYWIISHLFQGIVTEGEVLVRKYYELCLRELDPEDPLYITSMMTMGWWHIARGSYDHARALLQPALEKCRRFFGNEHLITCITMRGLDRILYKGDPDWLTALEGLVSLYEAWDKPDQAAAWRARLPRRRK